MADLIKYSFSISAGVYSGESLSVILQLDDHPQMGESIQQIAIQDIVESVEMQESGLPNMVGLEDTVKIQDDLDIRVKGGIKTVFISDERYFKPRGG